MAIEDIESMKREGLEPTPRDIVKLNALACKYERAKAKYSFSDAYSLPRIATIADGVWFRQPTIGHEIWLDKVMRFIDDNDYSTVLAVNAYALSRDWSELPDADDIATVKKAVEEYTKTMSGYMRPQIFAAIYYVKNGMLAEDEQPEHLDKHDETDEDGEKDDGEDGSPYDCIALGRLHEAQAVLWGVSPEYIRSLTRSQLAVLVERAYELHGWDVQGDTKRALSDYYMTLDAIRDRLSSTKAGE